MITFTFFGLLFVSLILYWLIPKQSLRNLILVLASFAFLYFVDKWSIAVVLGLTLFSYLFGNLIYRYPKKAYIHTLGLIGILGSLIVFKYLGFLTGILNSFTSFINGLPSFEIKKLLLPLGISYIVFKHISYLTDIKWGLVKPGRFIDFLLYSSLYTIFVAGPIERFERFKPQVEQQRIPFSWNNIEYGFLRIVFGMFKKLVLADWIGYFINPVWQNPHHYSQWIGLLALVGYSFQIYFDFAGYSDIAIGSSRLYGIKIMENFNNPYLAPNISQFWGRWHISLSEWIRDYLFFPMTRLGKSQQWFFFGVPVVAMAFCGLWHGAAWHYILWGIWHGVGISIYQIHKKNMRSKQYLALVDWFSVSVSTFLGTIITYSFVTYGWIFFHTGRGRLIFHNGITPAIFLLLPISIIIILILKVVYAEMSAFASSISSYKTTIALYILLAVAILYCPLTGEFVYAYF